MRENENRPVVAQNGPIGRNPPSFPPLQVVSASRRTDVTVCSSTAGAEFRAQLHKPSIEQMGKHNHAEILFTSPEFTGAR